MKLEELSQPLDELQAKELERAQEENFENEEIVLLIEDAREACLSISGAEDIIWEINQRQEELDSDRDVKKSPYYYILLAFACYRIGQTDDAETYAGTAESLFKCQSEYWHQSICNWFLGVMLCKLGQINKAKEKIKRAIEVASRLDKRSEPWGLYPTKYECLKRTIEDSYFELENRVQGVFQNAPQMVPLEVFLQFIHRLRIPGNAPELYKQWETACDINPFDTSDVIAQIATLNNMLLLKNEDMPIDASFAHIFLGHFYNIRSYSNEKQDQKLAIQCVSDSIREFQDYPDELNTLNQAFSCWYLGLLYGNISDMKTGLPYLDEAYRLLDELLREYQYQETDIEYIQNLQNNIRIWISKFKTTKDMQKHHDVQRSRYGVIDKVNQIFSRRTSAYDVSSSANKKSAQLPKVSSAPEPTEYSTKPFDVEQVSLRAIPQSKWEKKLERKQNLQGENPQALHIIIPVDMQALNDPCLDAIPLEASLFEKLQEYHEHKANLKTRSNRSSAPGDNKANIAPMVPRLPIYGYATAGPDGKVNLPDALDLEYASSVDENCHVKFRGYEYFAKSMKEDDAKIPYNKNLKFGWLKIEGDSMTNASPVSISEADYVLFYIYEMRDLESLIGKIVISALPDDVQPARLMVKYLEKKKGKFFLHSESLSHDYQDIELAGNHQIVGEVVAIAKPL